jgi:hypothetical protein
MSLYLQGKQTQSDYLSLSREVCDDSLIYGSESSEPAVSHCLLSMAAGVLRGYPCRLTECSTISRNWPTDTSISNCCSHRGVRRGFSTYILALAISGEGNN